MSYSYELVYSPIGLQLKNTMRIIYIYNINLYIYISYTYEYAKYVICVNIRYDINEIKLKYISN